MFVVEIGGYRDRRDKPMWLNHGDASMLDAS